MFEILRHALNSGTWNSVPVWNPSLVRLGYGLTEASLSVDLEDSGELSFAVPPGHPLYDLFDLDEVYVTECSVNETSVDGLEKEIWRGFLTGSETDLQGVKTVNCRGVRSYLAMSIHQLEKKTYTTRTLLEALINNHNAQMRLGGHAQNEHKLFRLGTVDVEGTVVVEKSSDDDENEEDYEAMPYWKCALLILIGIGCIVAGGQLVVENAKAIAKTFGMSETLIGLTIIAVGTSLPELVTSIVASKKGENGLAVGNVVGSSIFNLLFILGTSATIHPIAVNMESIFDLAIVIAVCVVTYFMAFTKNISRLEGAILLLLYGADVAFAIIR